MSGNNSNTFNQGRGASDNPKNRYKNLHHEQDPEQTDLEHPEEPETELIRDDSETILSENDSPDVGFDVSVNPYRGCEHGCIYCYARPTHEMLGFSSGLDFESRIVFKPNAPELLRKELSSSSYEPAPIAISGVTDPYQPVERKLELTRGCLEVLSNCRHPAGIVTKNELVTRDVDLLSSLAEYSCIVVSVSVTTLDKELCRKMEPRTSQPHRRLRTIERLAEAGIPVRVNVAPVIPGLTDHEIPEILEKASDAGANYAAYVLLRLPRKVKDLFINWLEEEFPDRKKKVLDRIRSTRGGDLNDSTFHSRMKGSGIFAGQVRQLFEVGCRNNDLETEGPSLDRSHFRSPGATQRSLFS